MPSTASNNLPEHVAGPDTVAGLVILDPPGSGERNMAVDEALLVNATPEWPIVLRIYRWDRPTLSLGHFQKLEDREGIAKLAELPWVRRKTGGGAIVHDQEWTYSIVIPNRTGRPAKGHNEGLYRAVHLQFVQELRRLGWDAMLSESCTCQTTPDKAPEPFLCFSRRSPVDLVVGNDKILGSAQRKSANGLLQHGSFLLRRSVYAPHLAGLLDGEPYRNSAQFGVGQAAVGKPTPEADFWEPFFVATLKQSVTQLLQVKWENGTLSDLPGCGDGF